MAATPPKAKDPLDALQLLVNDVVSEGRASCLAVARVRPVVLPANLALARSLKLVQTGKALRASRRDSQGNLPPSFGSCQHKLPDTIKAFHAALDDLERDIVSLTFSEPLPVAYQALIMGDE